MRVVKDNHRTSENNLRQSVEYLSVLVRVAVALAPVGVRRHIHGVPRSRLTVRLGRLVAGVLRVFSAVIVLLLWLLGVASPLLVLGTLVLAVARLFVFGALMLAIPRLFIALVATIVVLLAIALVSTVASLLSIALVATVVALLPITLIMVGAWLVRSVVSSVIAPCVTLLLAVAVTALLIAVTLVLTISLRLAITLLAVSLFGTVALLAVTLIRLTAIALVATIPLIAIALVATIALIAIALVTTVSLVATIATLLSIALVATVATLSIALIATITALMTITLVATITTMLSIALVSAIAITLWLAVPITLLLAISIALLLMTISILLAIALVAVALVATVATLLPITLLIAILLAITRLVPIAVLLAVAVMLLAVAAAVVCPLRSLGGEVVLAIPKHAGADRSVGRVAPARNGLVRDLDGEVLLAALRQKFLELVVHVLGPGNALPVIGVEDALHLDVFLLALFPVPRQVANPRPRARLSDEQAAGPHALVLAQDRIPAEPAAAADCAQADDIIVDVFMRAVSGDVFVDDGLFLHLIGQEGEDAGVVPAGREGVKLLLVVADDELCWVETEIIRVESIHPSIQGRHNSRGGQGSDGHEGDEHGRPQDGRRGRHLGGRWRRRWSC